jgi:16S rRNA (cytidine1402-2'-O)-methyltransferase
MSESIPTTSASVLHIAQQFVQGQHLPASSLYVIATPIGNLADISLRALAVLSMCDTVCAEDTRVTRNLLQVYGVSRTNIVRNDAHTEASIVNDVLARLGAGERIALVSDAGTPAISDPGALLVAAVRQAGFNVVAIPGASSVVALLSVAGLRDTAFTFLGFAPTHARERDAFCERLSKASRTQIFFESPHRALALLNSLAPVLNPTQHIVIGRELSKRFESIHSMAASELKAWLATSPKLDQGEFVIAVGKAVEVSGGLHGAATQLTTEQLLKALLPHIPLKTAVNITSELTSSAKNAVYEQALVLKSGIKE